MTVFQVLHKLKQINKTRSTLPIDLPDRLRQECEVDLAEPLTDIINSCLRDGVFPEARRREWVTALPKPNRDLRTCGDLRKIASTSDYSKLFEKFLMEFIIEDIGHKVDIQQYAGRKGTGTEHLLVSMVDRILSLLDKPGMTAVIRSAADWAAAFDRTDPTKSIQKFIKMGVRPSLIPILAQFLTDRKMSVKFNQKESTIHKLIGGGPQGSQTGQEVYIVASDDNAYHVPESNRYKYCDDLNILELVMLGEVLVEYDFKQHVASDIGIDQQIVDPQKCKTPEYLNTVATWTKTNLMKLNEAKSDYQIFTKSRKSFAARFSINNKIIERKTDAKVLGLWLQEDGGWSKNTAEICKSAYAKLSMLSKLKYAGVNAKDLLQVYCSFIRARTEYSCVAFHSSLNRKQTAAIEKIQSTSLKIIFPTLTYEEALEKANLKSLHDRRQTRCLNFGLKSIKHPQNKRIFPRNVQNPHNVRTHEPFIVNKANNEFYRRSAIPTIQRMLNSYLTEEEKREEESGRGGGERRRIGG